MGLTDSWDSAKTLTHKQTFFYIQIFYLQPEQFYI